VFYLRSRGWEQHEGLENMFLWSMEFESWDLAVLPIARSGYHWLSIDQNWRYLYFEKLPTYYPSELPSYQRAIFSLFCFSVGFQNNENIEGAVKITVHNFSFCVTNINLLSVSTFIYVFLVFHSYLSLKKPVHKTQTTQIAAQGTMKTKRSGGKESGEEARSISHSRLRRARLCSNVSLFAGHSKTQQEE